MVTFTPRLDGQVGYYGVRIATGDEGAVSEGEAVDNGLEGLLHSGRPARRPSATMDRTSSSTACR